MGPVLHTLLVTHTPTTTGDQDYQVYSPAVSTTTGDQTTRTQPTVPTTTDTPLETRIHWIAEKYIRHDRMEYYDE